MPKLQYSEKKGLVQSAGSGVVLTLGDASDAHEMTTSFKTQTDTVTTPNGSSSVALDITIPKCSILTSVKAEVLVADTAAVTLSKLTTAAGSELADLTITANALGSEIASVTTLSSFATDTTLALTFSSNTDGVGSVKVTVSYIELS